MEPWTTGRLLDAVKERMGIESDNALARIWGVSRQKISGYRTSDYTLSDEKAIHCADFLGIDPATVLIGIQAERAANGNRPEVADVLSRAAAHLAEHAKKAGKKAAGWIMVAVFLAGGPLPHPAQAAGPAHPAHAEMPTAFDNNTDYTH